MSAAERIRAIRSRDNPAYRELKALAEDKRARRETGRTLLDGDHLIETASAAGTRLPILVATDSVSEAGGLGPWLEALPAAQALVIPQFLFKGLSPTRTPSGIMAVAEIPVMVDAPADFAILLEDIQDPGNLGALLRAAAASGVEAAYLSSGCAEAWSPKALRGGQGAQFLLRVHEQVDLVEVAERYPGRCHAAVLDVGVSLYDLDLRGPCALAFGNEGAGLSAGLRAVCRPFTIPMSGGVESLNVAAAAAVCLFERARQSGGARRAKK
ncbi:MAG: RNA methyltransferase [Thiobacillaceae bacterium]|jgi:TrmH family RNA methyltransferase|nr:RNA methyltransferase [Thiobacillaceae bacterium]